MGVDIIFILTVSNTGLNTKCLLLRRSLVLSVGVIGGLMRWRNSRKKPRFTEKRRLRSRERKGRLRERALLRS